ncbi:MAG: DUF3160 domain-containing protein [Spirochaetes bacterium]|nr:DUF3160 domain-containing protein [Spirochaetota bacterium]
MKKAIIFCFILILLITCKNKESKKEEDTLKESDLKALMGDSEKEQDEDIKMLSIDEINTIIGKLSGGSPEIKERTVKKPQYTINKNYQDEPLSFKSFNTSAQALDKIGVIGTSGVKMYSDLDGKNEIMGLEKGDVVKILNEKKGPIVKDEQWGIEYDYYNFKGEYNYWYEVEYESKKGFVFGSYLVSNANTLSMAGEYVPKNKLRATSLNERLLKLSYYYKKGDKFDAFYDFNGSAKIASNIQDVLVKDKFAIQKVDRNEYWLNVDNPDDMISLYMTLHEDRMAATFITTDFLIHNLHLLFDRMLQETEQSILYPILKILIKKYYDKLIEIDAKLSDNDKSLKETIEMMKKYFLVPADILGVELMNRDSYPIDVKREIVLISEARGFEEAPIFKYKEDYSQFKPRGHYTKNNILKKYFKAMMWFGRLHFYSEITEDKNDLKRNIQLTRAALLLSKIAKEDSQIMNLWKAVFIPINYIVGESDDYNLMQYISISKDVDFNNFGKWIENEKHIISFMKNTAQNLQGPKISGNILRQHGEISAPADAKTPGGFRLFGQRFTFDSFIHNQLSSPRVGTDARPRNMVKGLDIMGVFGNRFADLLLAEDKKNIDKFNDSYNYLIGEVNKFSDTDWRKTFYNSYLRIIKEAAVFDNSMPFYFTQSDNWNKKALLTSHASWAELRHDTILYVKQSYAEKAGKGPEMTWVVDMVNRQIGYVEPNLGVLYWLESIITDSLELLVQYGFMTENFEHKFTEYKNIINVMVQIAELEANDKSITSDLNEFIYSVPYTLAKIVLPTANTDYIEEKDLQMALVADVHTDSFNEVVLEVATGIPYRIYAALNDNQGGKRIAEGYTYSYYEFTQPMNNRLNDDQWKEKVYVNDKNYIDSKIPLWLKDIIQN